MKKRHSLRAAHFLREENARLHRFPNGIRLVHKQIPHSKITHLAYTFDIGSRDESEDQNGLIHFWEHMSFKGTERRKAYHVLNRIESLGGDLDAFTTKEKVVFSASLIHIFTEEAFDLLSDISFFSTFPEKEILKERQVILEEISMYEDSPEDALMDDMDALLFPNHSLGRPILGTPESIADFRSEDFHGLRDNLLSNDRLVVSCVSPLPFSEVLPMAEKYLSKSPLSVSGKLRRRSSPKKHKASVFSDERRHGQAYYALGGRSFSVSDPKRLSFYLLMDILAGSSMNSRLNMSLREKHGLVYSIDSSWSVYTDAGSFMISFGSEQDTRERCTELLRKEIKKIKEKPLGVRQLKSAKRQFTGMSLMAEESLLNLAHSLGRQVLNTGKISSISSVLEHIEALSAAEILETAHEVFDNNNLSEVIYRPEER